MPDGFEAGGGQEGAIGAGQVRDMTSPEAEVQGWPGRHEERTVLTALFGEHLL